MPARMIKKLKRRSNLATPTLTQPLVSPPLFNLVVSAFNHISQPANLSFPLLTQKFNKPNTQIRWKTIKASSQSVFLFRSTTHHHPPYLPLQATFLWQSWPRFHLASPRLSIQISWPARPPARRPNSPFLTDLITKSHSTVNINSTFNFLVPLSNDWSRCAALWFDFFVRIFIYFSFCRLKLLFLLLLLTETFIYIFLQKTFRVTFRFVSSLAVYF